jgi:hypothetical protein
MRAGAIAGAGRNRPRLAGMEPEPPLSRFIAKEITSMRVTDGMTPEILVARDPEGVMVELQVVGVDDDGVRTIRLSREEARRLAALLLFEAARLDKPRPGWGPSSLEAKRRSA